MTQVIFMTAAFFDLLGFIPVLGAIFVPFFNFILFMVYGSKKKNLGTKMIFMIPISTLTRAILFFLPTNIANAYLTIYVFK